MNNANFGNDCRDNRNITKFQPIVDEIEEIIYIKKYYNLFDNNVSKFVNSNILEKQINQEFEQNLSTIKILELVKNEKMDALNCLKEKEKKGGKRKLTEDFETQVSDLIKNKKIKTMIDLNKRESNSIKSIVVNSSTTVDVSTRFCKGKMLMFAKMSLKLFVYDIIDVFCFPDDKVKGIFDKNDIEKCFLYLNLTDTDICSMFFVFICKLECCIPESDFRNVLFEIFKHSKIGPRLDVSDKFWQQFNMQNEGTRKVMGLYEVENLDNANLCTITINPKEYFEKFKDRKINKKHKGVRRDTPGMTFESFAERISSLRQLNTKSEKKN